MYVPPSDPDLRLAPDTPSWTGVFASYALVIAIPASMWVLASPLTRIPALALAVGLLVGVRHAARVARCVAVCRELTVDLAGAVRITIARPPTDGDACPR